MAASIILPDTESIRKAVSLINTIDTGKFSRLLSRILQKLHLKFLKQQKTGLLRLLYGIPSDYDYPKTESTFTEEEEEKLQAAFLVEKQDLHLVLETITFILEQAVYHNSKPTILKQQLEHSNLNPDKVEVLATAWATAGPEVVEKFRQRILSPHKLDSVGWQLNLQMAQSTQAKQKSPKAVLELGITNEDSKNMEKVFVEFSHEELFEFYNKLESIQAQLDSLT